MKKKKILGLCIVLATAFMSGHMYISAATAEPGSSSDPVVTESYMKQELAKLQSEITALKSQINNGGSTGGNTGSSTGSIGTGVVDIKGGLNIRSSASWSASVLKTIADGTTVTVNEESNGWYKITAEGVTGWVAKDYIKIVSSSSSGGSSNGAATLGVGTVTASSLNVRSGASTSASIIGSLTKGTTVTLLEKSGDWYKIKYGSTTGWVSASYISV